jgi:hypothetical protein
MDVRLRAVKIPWKLLKWGIALVVLVLAGSTGFPWRDEFLIGALSDPKVLLCKLHP